MQPDQETEEKTARGQTRGARKRHFVSAPAVTNTEERGHRGRGHQFTSASPSVPDAEGGHCEVVTQNEGAPSAHLADAGHYTGEAQAAHAHVGEMDLIVAEIRALHRDRCFAMEQRKRSHLALGAFLRRVLGWRLDLPVAERKKIADAAHRLIKIGENVVAGKKEPPVDDADWSQWGQIVCVSLKSCGHFVEIEEERTKRLEALAKTLPVWAAWGEGVRGFGARGLGTIVGEAGNLSNYATHSRLWKRMGLAVLDGVRQGGLPKNSRAEAWIAHGYNAARRSRMFVIGDVLVKTKGVYRDVYLARKKEEKTKAEAAGLTVCPSAKIPEKRKHEFMSDGHVHRRAQRFMEKRLLRDLWKAWRREHAAGGHSTLEPHNSGATAALISAGQHCGENQRALASPTPAASASRHLVKT